MAKRSRAINKLVDLNKIDEPEGIIRLEIDPDKIEELAESIRAMGQLQPIMLRVKGERFEIVYGHRRFLAMQQLGKIRIQATIRELDDETTALMRATENIAREDISPLEEAAVYKNLVDQGGLSAEQIASKMGKSGGLIKRRLDLLKMPPCLQKAVHRKEIGYSVAEELWRLGELIEIEYFLGFAVDHGATLAVVRQWVNEKLDERRREERGTVEGGGHKSPMQTRPVYVACDTCSKAMEVGEEEVFRCCPVCSSAIKKGLEGGE